MKTILTILILITPLTAFARIGESPAQCEKRYGKPVSMNKKDSSILYRKNDFIIFCTYWKGVVHSIMYTKKPKDSDVKLNLNVVEMRAFFDIYGTFSKNWSGEGIQTLNLGGKFYVKSKDGKFIASMEMNNPLSPLSDPSNGTPQAPHLKSKFLAAGPVEIAREKMNFTNTTFSFQKPWLRQPHQPYNLALDTKNSIH